MHAPHATRLFVLTALLALAGAQHLYAGPPLLCPPTSLSELEREVITECTHESLPLEKSVHLLLHKLEQSPSGRFHVEAIRHLFHTRGEVAVKMLGDALEQKVGKKPQKHKLGAALTPESRRHALLHYDRALARILELQGGSGQIALAGTMARMADRLEDGALWLTTAEAIDLTVLREPNDVEYLFSRSSYHYFERALLAAQEGEKDEHLALRRMIVQHTPYMKGMHGHDWQWEKFDRVIEGWKTTS